ncbi:MAG: hypothetical protein U1E67_17085 [Hyphomicrobiales bacterium]
MTPVTIGLVAMPLSVGAALLVGLLVSPTKAADFIQAAPTPPSGFFVGGGGSFNGVQLKQTGDGIGVTDVHDGDTLVGFGVAVGPMPTFKDRITSSRPTSKSAISGHLLTTMIGSGRYALPRAGGRNPFRQRIGQIIANPHKP